MRPVAGGAVLLLTAAALGALAGGLWAPLDSLAIAQPYIAGALLAVVLIPRVLPRAVRVIAVAVALLAGADMLRHLPTEAAGPGPVLRHVQHNLWQGNRAGGLLARMAEADVMTLQEVGDAIFTLRDRSPGWHLRICPRPGWVTTAALTRLPVLDSGCTPSGAAWIRLRTPDCFGGPGALTLVSVHLFWPWPHHGDRQAAQVDGLVAELSELPRPVLLGGDFNQMPWSAAVGRIARAVEGRVAGGMPVTYELAGGWLRLPIDHVVLGEGLTATPETGERHGSDHRLLRSEVRSAAGATDCR